MSGKGRRYTEVKSKDMPERIRFALQRFEEQTGIMMYNASISHLRDDAVFVRIPGGTLSIATAARLSKLLHDGIYIEIDAAANGMLDVRMFVSGWMEEHECKRQIRWMESDDKAQSFINSAHGEYIDVRKDKPI